MSLRGGLLPSDEQQEPFPDVSVQGLSIKDEYSQSDATSWFVSGCTEALS